jgi:hypothetical protein
MERYFELVSQEFELRTRQIREFIKKHNPSIGAFNEEILRKFLREFLPKWVSVGQGFIIDKAGRSSTQLDIIIYNSLFYAPLYSVNDLVVLPPEAVIIAIEVKTRINKNVFHESIAKNKILKQINPEIESQIFIYNPPSAKIMIRYLKEFDFSEYADIELIDKIYGLSKFCLSKENIVSKDQEGVGYINEIYKSRKTGNDAVFEAFYYNIYRVVEQKINKALKNGINNIWIIKDNSIEIKGRLGYSHAGISDFEFGNILINKKIKLPPTNRQPSNAGLIRKRAVTKPANGKGKQK